jgi:ribosomal RNA-processing protein 1
LKKFLSHPRGLPLLEFEKLWKGLFYSMWFSDRPRPQQRLANDLGQLFLVIPEQNYGNFSLAFWVIMSREWVGIDHHRLDKFLLLLRRVLFYQLKRLKESEWNENLVNDYLEALKKSPLSGEKKVPTGIPYHLIDIYADELERMLFEGIEEDDDDEESIENEKQQMIKDAPLETLIEPFVTLRKEALLKTMREKIRDDFLGDQRLKDWNVVEEEAEKEAEKTKVDDVDEDEDEGSSDDEWHGFD